MDDDYRSYLVRVRRSLRSTAGISVQVEDLLGGRRATVTGVQAEGIGDGLEAVIAAEAGTGRSAAGIEGDQLHRGARAEGDGATP